MFVNVYEVAREFGGHEEGGWYYDDYTCVHSHLLEADEDKNEVVDYLAKSYNKSTQGDITSVKGGVEVLVRVEDEKAESETLEVPEYS
ncbi:MULTISPECIES: hypothetical protein [Staphylococcaceae]|uniref:Uncharacterized protein n=1 Tax=Staphylococcus equorum TaxID=246432 RepID=A0AAP7LV24_9STAP|nr:MULTISPECIES: hypothetical protein [Staphylococcaceae]OEK59116.1 hypothetical protein ASS94_00180 [Staphylococcus equorum]